MLLISERQEEKITVFGPESPKAGQDSDAFFAHGRGDCITASRACILSCRDRANDHGRRQRIDCRGSSAAVVWDPDSILNQSTGFVTADIKQ